jgi:hypothetical protein
MAHGGAQAALALPAAYRRAVDLDHQTLIAQRNRKSN